MSGRWKEGEERERDGEKRGVGERDVERKEKEEDRKGVEESRREEKKKIRR